MVAVGDYWSLLIVGEIMHGVHRFSEIQRHLGLARNILAARLKRLVECGVLRLEPMGGVHQGYVLTEKGRDLHGVLSAFAQWGERWLPQSPADCGDDAVEFEPEEPALV
jgi:DNA-binding HxlR family transcriptional regulator